MNNFWDYSVWGAFNLTAVLLISLIVASLLKKMVKILDESLIPTSVLGGGVLLAIAVLYKFIFKEHMFETPMFGGKGGAYLEIFTYHTLALGFIASTFTGTNEKFDNKRRTEVLNTGITTVATYLLQGVFGMVITIVAAMLVKEFFSAAGILLPFGYGQGTGQAMNYGNIFEQDFGFVGGKSFGLTIAALGFLSASFGGVIHLTYLKKKNRLITFATERKGEELTSSKEKEIPLFVSMDTLSVQLALIMGTYLLTFVFMWVIGNLVPGLKSVIYGFNFLFGVIMATVVKVVVNKLYKKNLLHKEYINGFFMTRMRNFFFDIMVVAGVAAIRFSVLKNYLWVIIILGVVGLLVTYIYLRFVCKTLFKDYIEEQFAAMYGMLTGTASTGIILLREIDENFESPAADNLVYQNFPAMVLGFPIMILATLAPKAPVLTTLILFGFFVILNILLFRAQIFKKLKKK